MTLCASSFRVVENHVKSDFGRLLLMMFTDYRPAVLTQNCFISVPVRFDNGCGCLISEHTSAKPQTFFVGVIVVGALNLAHITFTHGYASDFLLGKFGIER